MIKSFLKFQLRVSITVLPYSRLCEIILVKMQIVRKMFTFIIFFVKGRHVNYNSPHDVISIYFSMCHLYKRYLSDGSSINYD